MFGVLIVDDELMIRNGIAKVIKWDRLAVDVVKTAASGAQALEVLADTDIHLMLTDINMTEMDGIELIEKARALQPSLKIIVLTGYDNFDYAQRCCKLQVQDFLLKPIDEAVLFDGIQHQLTEIQAEVEQIEKQKHLGRVQGVLDQVRLEQALRELLRQQTFTESIKQTLSEYHYKIEQPMQIAVLLPELHGHKSGQDDQELLTLSIKHLCINTLDSNGEGITCEGPNGELVLILFSDSEQEESTQKMEKLHRIIEDEYDVQTKVFLGSMVGSFRDLPFSYAEINGMMQSKQGDVLANVIQPQTVERRMQLFNNVLDELKKAMLQITGDYEQLDRTFRSFEECMGSYNLSVALYRRCCFEVASALYYEYILESGASIGNNLNALLGSLLTANKEDACRFTRNFLNQLFAGKDKNTHEIIEYAKRYIIQHLSDELSVASLAESMYVTPNYFSRLFKKVCGEGCNEYIVKRRIDMAKSLLETTNQRTGKVATLVGYHDTNYFSLAFKKHTGMSPTEYRESVRTTSEELAELDQV